MDSNAGAGARPGMRRKSSASNLLSFAKAPMPPGTAGIGVAVHTPVAKEWDAQSLYSDGSAAVLVPPLPATSVEAIRDMLGKRITALSHIRHGHEGSACFTRSLMLIILTASQ